MSIWFNRGKVHPNQRDISRKRMKSTDVLFAGSEMICENIIHIAAKSSRPERISSKSGLFLYLAIIFIFLAPNALAEDSTINPGPLNLYTGCGSDSYSGCTAGDMSASGFKITASSTSSDAISCTSCSGGYATANLQATVISTAENRYNVFFLFGIDKNGNGAIDENINPNLNEQYRVLVAGTLEQNVPVTINVPIRWPCGTSTLSIVGPSKCSNAFGGPVITYSQQDLTSPSIREPDNEHEYICHINSKCKCLPMQTLYLPCTANAPDFSICQGTPVNDLLFTSNKATCEGTCSPTLDYHLVDSSTPGTYEYIITCTGSVCGSDPFDTGTVTVVAKPDCTITARSACELSENNIASVADAGTTTTYAWTVTGDGELVNGQNTPTITWKAKAYSAGKATISVIVTGPEPLKCPCSSSKDVPVYKTPTAGIEVISIAAPR